MTSEESPAPGTSEWPDDVRVTGSTVVPPDRTIMEAIGLNYGLEAAIADLVDNSIDAGASSVLVRFMRRGPRLVSLCVVDDGQGMDASELDDAMALGKRRDYDPDDLGHFGLGLKAASLGQARSLTVISRAAGAAPSGRRWRKESVGEEFACEVVESRTAEMLLGRSWHPVGLRTGTLVRWDGVTDFPQRGTLPRPIATSSRPFPGSGTNSGWCSTGSSLGRGLPYRSMWRSLTLERRDRHSKSLRSTRSAIGVAVDRTTQGPSMSNSIPGPSNSDATCGRPDHNFRRSEFPSPLSIRDRVSTSTVTTDSYRLGDGTGVIQQEPRFQLARVAVEVGDGLACHFSMNPEKTRIRTTDAFIEAVESAQSGELDLRSYLEHATMTFRQARKRAGTRQRVVPPGRGFAPLVRQAIGDELEFVAGAEPIDIRWQDLDDDAFFSIDRQSRLIRLNRRYRWAVTGDRGTSLNDAPLIKATLYLLLNDLFRGERFGAKQKDSVNLWSSILAAAARAESE